MPEIRRTVHIDMGPLPDLGPVWCEKGQMDCYEQPLNQPPDAPLQPCRWCEGTRA